MRRLLLAVAALLAAGAAFSQDTLYGYELYYLIIEDSNQGESILNGSGGSFAHKGYTISYPTDIRKTGLTEAKADPDYYATVCPDSVALGIGFCNQGETYSFPLWAMNWYMEWSVINRYAEGSGCTETYPYRRQYQIFGGSGGASGGCFASQHAAAADQDVTIYAAGNYLTRTDTWYLEESALASRVTCTGCTYPTAAEFNERVYALWAEGFLTLEPTVDELVLDWGVTISGAYVDGGWCESTWTCDGTTAPGEAPAGEGGTDWEDGQHATRCDGTGELNIFQGALFYAFEPCEPWSQMFADANASVGDKQPFGYLGWMSFADGQCGPGLGECAFNVSSADPTAQDAAILETQDGYEPEEIAWQSRGGFVWEIPAFSFGVFEVPAVSFNPFDTSFGRWWANVGRVWLFYFFVASFYLGVFYRVIR